MVAIAVSLILCMNSIRSVWLKWQNKPVVMNYDSKTIPIEMIPFPAVAICANSKFSAKKFNYTAVYRAMFKLDGNNSREPTENE